MDKEIELITTEYTRKIDFYDLELRIKEMYNIFFKDSAIKFDEFKTFALRSNINKNYFIDSLEYLSKSEQMREEHDKKSNCLISDHLSMLLLFISIESLMGKGSHYPFDQWLVTSKSSVLGKERRDELLKDINEIDTSKFGDLIRDLYEVYNEHYGVSKKIRLFFTTYLNKIQKRDLITSISFIKRTGDNTRKSVYICFEKNKPGSSDASTFVKGCEYYNHCKYRDNCKLENDIDKVMGKFANFLYGYYRSSFAHNGKISAFYNKSELSNILMDTYNETNIKIKLSYDNFKELIKSGIINYYHMNSKNQTSSSELAY